ncbi:MAG TPA: OmpA family protein [Lacipirellulaceae bacterium]
MLIAALRWPALVLPILLSISTAIGCGRYAFTQNTQQPQPVTLSPEQQQALALQTQQYQQRATALDHDNQELQSMLAQSRQQAQLMQEQVTATQTQLRDTANQLASLQSDNDQMRSRTTAMAASIQTRSQAEIRPNNSLLRNLTITNLPGVQVRQDGDVVRVELPADQLFNPGTAQIKMGSDDLLRSVGADIVRNYPQQLIGIEGHTDSSPPTSAQMPTAQHLSVAQAMAVYDALVRTAGVPANQLFVVGHGSSHPVVSNGTDAGRARNRRVELVIYPETMPR